jgi:hypothetical protein
MPILVAEVFQFVRRNAGDCEVLKFRSIQFVCTL